MPTTQKISISVDRVDLKWLRRRARRNGGNLSAVFAEAAHLLKQHEAREAVVAYLGDAAKLSPADVAAIEAEWEG